MGGAAVLRAASQVSTLADGLIIEAVYDRLLTTVKNRFEAIHVPPTPFAHLLVFWGGIQHGFNAFDLNPSAFAKSVSIPTLMLHGERDERARVADAQAVYDNLGGVKQIEIFAGVGHQSCYNSDAEKWQMLISRFLEKQNP
jgi:pimeloyl-ACP methyl ester carboxylesterase